MGSDQEKRLYPSSVNRRSFFRGVLHETFDWIEQAAQTLNRLAKSQLSVDQSSPGETAEDGADKKPGGPASQHPVFLRPPGALPPIAFADTCSRCGKCVEACPAGCIKLSDAANGLPYIVARWSPCVVCDELACMNVCPTGALQPLDQVDQINMGQAEVNPERCLRTNDTGANEDCRICVDQCPVGPLALQVGESGLLEVGDGCTGCGVCEWSCPTEPPSITVRPSERLG